MIWGGAPSQIVIETAPTAAEPARSAVVAATLADATLSAAGTVVVASALAETLADATLAATGTVVVAGTLAETLADATLAATGTTGANDAVVAATLADATLAATGTVVVAGTLAATLADATLAATGSSAAVAPMPGFAAVLGGILQRPRRRRIEGEGSIFLRDLGIRLKGSGIAGGVARICIAPPTLTGVGRFDHFSNEEMIEMAIVISEHGIEGLKPPFSFSGLGLSASDRALLDEVMV